MLKVKDFIYKAVTIDTKEWVIGDLVRRTYHKPDGTKRVEYSICAMDVWVDNDDIPVSQSGGEWNVIPETICLFTGQYDGTPYGELTQTERDFMTQSGFGQSDWKGRPIFTNDIVMNGAEQLTCVWRNTDFVLRKKNGRPQTLMVIKKCRVKGNLHDDAATGGIKAVDTASNDIPY